MLTAHEIAKLYDKRNEIISYLNRDLACYKRQDFPVRRYPLPRSMEMFLDNIRRNIKIILMDCYSNMFEIYCV